MDESIEFKSCYNLINRYENYINTINNIIYDINNYNLENKKDYKHNPFSLDSIDKVEILDKKLVVKYKNNKIQYTNLFDYNEKHRSFSFEENKQNHTKLIITQLQNEINLINVYINVIQNLISQNKNSVNDILSITDIGNYNLDDILKIKEDINEKCYYLSICPIYGFFLKNDKIYIANQYFLKFKNNTFYLWYSNKYDFKKLLSRPHLHNKILEFNKNKTKLTSDNFLIVIKNMSSIFTDCEVITSDKKIKYELGEIDKPINEKIM